MVTTSPSLLQIPALSLHRAHYNVRNLTSFFLSSTFNFHDWTGQHPTIDTMRNTLVFSGSSCPALTAKICENLGTQPAEAELSQFSNVCLFPPLEKSSRARQPPSGYLPWAQNALVDKSMITGRNECAHIDQRPREGCLRGAIGKSSDQRHHHGASYHDLGLQRWIGEQGHW